HEDPRVTKPYSDAAWAAIDALGQQVDVELHANDVRLTQGGEPTFVSIDDRESEQWTIAAHGAQKRELAAQLLLKLKAHHAPGGLLHFGQGKWYPGEPLPRWALSVYWRADGKPLWQDAALFALDDSVDHYTVEDASRFAQAIVARLQLPPACLIPAYEDVVHQVMLEQKLPANLDPLKLDLKDSAERRRLATLLAAGLGVVAGFVVPLKAISPPEPMARLEPLRGTAPPAQWRTSRWRTSKWPLRRERLYLVPGDSPLGLRLPLESLPWVLPKDVEPTFGVDPFAPRDALSEPRSNADAPTVRPADALPDAPDPREVIHTAFCVQVRDGRLHCFMPPVPRLEDSLALIAAIEATAAQLKVRVRFEGYPPPWDPRLRSLSVTPDPGVIEVNVQPAGSWPEITANVQTLYELARLTRLATEKFMLDGRHTGTGGGNHVTLGGPTPADSPLLRRPDVLRSLITYWQNHPALSYLFSGAFIGPTSQAPRVDEARDDTLYELAIAFQQMEEALPQAKVSERPWLVDRLLRNLLVDLTGNTHRAEFSIDKLYSPDTPTGRLGLVEFRAFEMPPHAQMSLVQMLLLRALVARFWREPYRGRLIHWGTELHDRWMLPHFIERDIQDVARDLQTAGYPFAPAWFDPFVEFRFPRYGTVVYDGVEIELRQAIEPWNVLGEEVSRSGTSRYVDSSVERLQVRVRGLTESRHVVTCNGRPLPLAATGVPGEAVAGVRFRAWAPPSA
ncbi:MAG: transglutaminase family protein, partial [Burkholderiales bacterium]